MLISQFLERAAHHDPDALAVDDGTRTRTFGELAQRVERLARAFAARGFDAGTRIGVLARNRVEYCELYFAIARAGCVCVPVNWRLHPSEIASLLDDSEARAFVVEAHLAASAAIARERCRAVELWLAVDAADAKWLDYEAFFAAGGSREPAPPNEGDVALQMYTSGTTGTPKGALLTHRNVAAMVLALLHEMALEPGESRLLQAAPVFHIAGMLQVVATAAARVPLLLAPEFSPGPTLDRLEREPITHTLFVPAMLQWMLADARLPARRFPALRRVMYGAAPTPVAQIERALAAFRCEFVQGYGLTEMCGVLTTLRPKEHAGERLASVGRAVLGTEVRVVDESGRDVAPGAVGEILARGDTLFRGYWKRPDESRECMQGGWLATGDLARLDRAGFVYVVDRKKDMLIVGGENVYPREVELALLEHAAVADAAVIGIPHVHWGEEVLAFVVLRAGAITGQRDLIHHCRDRLARFKCPTRVEFTAQIPRNAAGKALKRDLREPFWRQHARRV